MLLRLWKRRLISDKKQIPDMGLFLSAEDKMCVGSGSLRDSVIDERAMRWDGAVDFGDWIRGEGSIDPPS